MDCADILEMLTPYHDGELDAAGRGGVDAHLAGCASCRRDYAELKSLVGAVRAVPREPAPAGFLDDVKRRIAADEQKAHGPADDETKILAFPQRKVRWAPYAGAAAAGVLAALVGALVMVREEADRAPSMREEFAQSKGAPAVSAPRAASRPALHAANRADDLARDESRTEADVEVFAKAAAPARLKAAAKDGFDAPASQPVASAVPVPAGPREAEEKAAEPVPTPLLAAAPPAPANEGAAEFRAAAKEAPRDAERIGDAVATRIRAEVFAPDPVAACRWSAANADPLEVAPDSVVTEVPDAVVQGKNIRDPDIVQGNRFLYLREADRIRLRGTPAQIRAFGDRLESQNYLVRTPAEQDAYAAWRGGDRDEERRIQLETGALLDRAGGLRADDVLVAQSRTSDERRARTAGRSAAAEGAKRAPEPESEPSAEKPAAPEAAPAGAAPAAAGAASADSTARQESIAAPAAVQAFEDASVKAPSDVRIEVELQFLPLSAWGSRPAESRKRR